VSQEALESEILDIIKRLALPDFIYERLCFEIGRAEKAFLKQNKGLLDLISDEIREIANNLDALGLVKTKDKREQGEELVRSAKLKIFELVDAQKGRLPYMWLKTVANNLGPRLPMILSNSFSLRTFCTELIEYIYIKDREIRKIKFSGSHGFAIFWAKHIVGYINPKVDRLVEDKFGAISIPEFAKLMTKEGDVSSHAIELPTIQHQEYLKRKKMAERKTTDADLFISEGILSNKTYKDVEIELKRRLKKSPDSLELNKALADLQKAKPRLKEMAWYRYGNFAEGIRTYADTLDEKVLESMIFDVSAYFLD